MSMAPGWECRVPSAQWSIANCTLIQTTPGRFLRNDIPAYCLLHTAYRQMNLGDHSLEADDVEGALAHYGQAEALAPDNLEMKFWHAVSLVNAGRVEAAVPLFETVFRQDRDWQTLLPRLAEEELVKVDAATLSRIMNVVPQEAMQ